MSVAMCLATPSAPANSHQECDVPKNTLGPAIDAPVYLPRHTPLCGNRERRREPKRVADTLKALL
jgi:hypothetical protein